MMLKDDNDDFIQLDLAFKEEVAEKYGMNTLVKLDCIVGEIQYADCLREYHNKRLIDKLILLGKLELEESMVSSILASIQRENYSSSLCSIYLAVTLGIDSIN